MLPFIIIGAVTGGIGTATGVKGATWLIKAKTIGKESKQRYDSTLSQFEASLSNTQQISQKLTEQQIKTHQNIRRYIEFNRQNSEMFDHQSRQILDRLECVIQTDSLNDLNLEFGKTGRRVVGEAAKTALKNAPNLLGVSSMCRTVGVRVLPRVIARRALLAGTVMVTGPALMVAGFELAEAGQRALTKAEEYRGEVEVDIEKLKQVSDYLSIVDLRLNELLGLLKELNGKISCTLQDLGTWPAIRIRRQRKKYRGEVRQLEILMSLLLDILTIPVLNEDGELNTGIAVIREKYRRIAA